MSFYQSILHRENKQFVSHFYVYFLNITNKERNKNELYLFNFKLGIVNFKLRIVNFKLGIVNFKSGIVNFKLGIVNFKMRLSKN